jgi:tRNA (guanine-N7-)-methyltransferase
VLQPFLFAGVVSPPYILFDVTTYKEIGMSRRRLARRLAYEPPEVQNAQKYLLQFNSRDLFYTPAAFPRLDSKDLFGNDLALKMEIGCGTADFICALASKEPQANFIGLDISWKPLFRAVSTAASLGLDNIKFIKANFRVMWPLFVPASLETVYLHFPDPNQRPKFHKRQLFSPAFLDQMDKALTPSGYLSVMTDHAQFFMEMLSLVEQDGRFEKRHGERYLVGFESEVKSRFQRIWEKYDLPILRFEVKKRCANSRHRV